MTSTVRHVVALVLIGQLVVPAAFAEEGEWDGLFAEGKQAFDRREHDRAETLLAQALEVARRFEATDSRYLKTLHKIGDNYRFQRKSRKALDVFEKELERRTAELDAGSPDLAPLMQSYAWVLAHARQDDESEEMFLDALSLVEGDLEAHGEQTISILHSLAQLYEIQERLEDAIEIRERAVALRNSRSGFQGSSLHHGLARDYVEVGELDSAARVYALMLETLIPRRGAEDELVLRLKEEYAAVLRQLDREDEAAAVLRPAPLPHPSGPDPATHEIYVPGQDGVSVPRIVRKSPPDYPERARADAVEGRVVLQVVIAADGTVRSTETILVSEKGLGFEEAARKAVMKWRYEPAMLDGMPVAVRMPVNFDFSLN